MTAAVVGELMIVVPVSVPAAEAADLRRFLAWCARPSAADDPRAPIVLATAAALLQAFREAENEARRILMPGGRS